MQKVFVPKVFAFILQAQKDNFFWKVFVTGLFVFLNEYILSNEYFLKNEYFFGLTNKKKTYDENPRFWKLKSDFFPIKKTYNFFPK